MKRLFLAAIFAVGAIATTQAQTTQSQCCDRVGNLDLNVAIEPILCLTPQCQPDGWVFYDCPPDFAVAQDFRQGPSDPFFVFGVWSNKKYDITVRTLTTAFNKPAGAPASSWAIGIGNVDWRVLLDGFIAAAGASSVHGAYANDLSTTPASGNAINAGNPVNGQFALNFRMRPLASAWNYWPGVHTLDVVVTATFD